MPSLTPGLTLPPNFRIKAFLEETILTWGDNTTGAVPAGQAIRNREVQITNDLV